MYLLLTICISAAGFFCIAILPVALNFFVDGDTNHAMRTQLVVSAGIISVAIVIGCTLLAVSPLGEWVARLLLGVRKLVGREKEVLTPLLASLTEQVAKKGKAIHVRPYIVDDPYPMSYAIGKGTIVVTSGLLSQADDEEIAGALAHEFGHLYHEDTKRSLAQWGALLPLMLYFRLWMVVIRFLQGSGSAILGLAGLFLFIFVLPYKLIIDLWAMIGRKLSQRIEYRADAFAAEIGERAGLVRILERYSEIDHQKWGLAEQLMSTHPPVMYRIGKLENIE